VTIAEELAKPPEVDCPAAYKRPAAPLPEAKTGHPDEIRQHDAVIISRYGALARRHTKLVGCVNDWRDQTKPKETPHE
jgi:hypothetical protein